MKLCATINNLSSTTETKYSQSFSNIYRFKTLFWLEFPILWKSSIMYTLSLIKKIVCICNFYMCPLLCGFQFVYIWSYLCSIWLWFRWEAFPLHAWFPGVLWFLQLNIVVHRQAHDDLPGWWSPRPNVYKLYTGRKEKQYYCCDSISFKLAKITDFQFQCLDLREFHR